MFSIAASIIIPLMPATVAETPATQPTSSYIVLIGDSIAEGHPAHHGRLHAADGKFDPSHADRPGQLGFELAKQLGIRVLNQGIGGQSSLDVRKRWDRDVSGLSVDPGDGRGDRTLSESDVRPVAVYLHVGINDFSLRVPGDELRSNFIFFAERCRTEKIRLIVDNVGAENDTRWFTAEVQAAVHQFNRWLSTDLKQLYPEILIVDYCAWSTAGTRNLAIPNPEMFVDDVHPNEKGYADFADFAAKQVRLLLKTPVLPSTPSTRRSE